MSLPTPEKIRTLQKKLYLKAKAEPDYRFYLLYDKIYREDILIHAYRLAKAKTPILNTDPDVIVSITLKEFRRIIGRGCIRAIQTYPGRPNPALKRDTA